jgi:MFS family permease
MISRAWLTVGVLWIIAALNYLDRLMITTMRDPIKAEIQMSDAQFGLLTSIFLWVYGAFSPFGGFLADRFGRRHVILASLLVWSAVTWISGCMRTFEGLLIARGLLGLSQACYVPAALALIADFHRGPTRSLATGIHMSGIYAGAALSGVGGVVAEHAGWRSGFVWFGVLGVVYAVFAHFLLKDPEGATSSANEGERERAISVRGALDALLVQRGFLLLLVVTALVGLANWAVYGWLPTYLKDRFSLGLGAAGMVATGYIQVASFAGVVGGGVWADRWGQRQPRGRMLVPAIGFGVAAPLLLLGIGSDLLWVAVLVLIAYGVARGFYDANQMPILRTIAAERYSATGYGALNFVSALVGGAMVYVGGGIKDSNIDLIWVFYAAAVSLLLAGGVLCLIRPARIVAAAR